MSALQHVNVEAMDPQRFESVLSVGEFEALRYLIADAARGLHGRVIWNVNSTANGGGVAEMLRPPARILPRPGRIYDHTLVANAAELVELVHPEDLVILHDPQTAGLAQSVRRTGATVIWRCHVGLDNANDYARGAWSFLRGYVVEAHRFVFSRGGLHGRVCPARGSR